MTNVSHSDAQKLIECRHLRSFRRACSDFPSGTIILDETPDFVLDTTLSRIGIEHTQVYVDGGKKRGNLQSWEFIKNRITRRAEQIFDENDYPEVYVGLFFNTAPPRPRKKDEERISRSVADTVSRNIPELGDCIEVNYQIGSGQPLEVDLISIFRTTNFGNEHWQWREAGEVTTEAIEPIQLAIDKKMKTLANCRSKCEECWLLIVAPSWTPAGFVHPNDATLQHIYTSDFDRTYFLNLSYESVVKLNTIPVSIQDRKWRWRSLPST